MEIIEKASHFVYLGNPAEFEYENDYDFIIGFMEGEEHYMYKPDSLSPDQKIYLLNHENEIITEETKYCFPKDFKLKVSALHSLSKSNTFKKIERINKMGRDFQYFFHARTRASSSSGSEKDEYVHRSRSFECRTQEYEELNYISRRNNFIPSGTFNRAELKAEIERLLKELDKNCEKSSEIFEAIGALGMVGKEFCSMYVTILYD